MNTDIEPTTRIHTRVSQSFNGVSIPVPEWPGFSHEGKPAVISRVTISYAVEERGVGEPNVSVDARVVKKDGTLGAQEIDTRFALSFENGRALRDELLRDYGSDVLVLAVQTSNKLYG